MAIEPVLVGVDVGTTNIKAVIFDLRGKAVAKATAPTPTRYPKPTWACYNPEELWQRTVTALQQATSMLDDTHLVVSIAVASMAETAVPLDSSSLPTYDAVAWFDRRARPQAEWLDHVIGRDRLFAISGLSLQPIYGLCKLLWLKQNEPAVFKRTALWLNVADYIAFRLSGVAATDYSLASRILALNLGKLEWDTDLLREIGVPSDIMAPLRPSGTRLGQIRPQAAKATGLPVGTQVVVGGHDHICGALAIGVTEPGSMLDSIGTSEAIFLPIDRPMADPQLGRQGFAQGVHAMADRYYVLGGLYTSGICLEWFRDILDGDVDYARLSSEAEGVAPGSMGVCFVPHLRMANTPHADPLARGAFIGLSTDTGRGVLFRAILEGIAMEVRSLIEALMSQSDIALHDIHAIGGGTQSSLLMRIKATVLNQTIVIPDVEEAVALGAAILGGLGTNIYSDAAEALSAIEYSEISIDPSPDLVGLYNALFQQVYSQIYPALRPLNHNIHRLHSTSFEATSPDTQRVNTNPRSQLRHQ
ncbi:MAG: carbohydrate kinase [Chloroflexi bacterium]|nr:carbohydrate kinase [Chloroflexota bacterium]